MEFIDTFNELKNLLNESGLNWIVKEVEQEIETGKFFEEKHATLKESGNDIAGTRYSRGKKVDFTKRKDYEAKEKLILLLDGLSTGVIEPIKIEASICSRLGSDVDSIKFFDENSVEEKERIISDDDGCAGIIQILKQHVENLKLNLDKSNA